MKTHTRKLLVLVLLAIFCLSLVCLTACSGKNQPDPATPPAGNVDYGIDNVFYTKDAGKEYLFTISGNTFMISGFNGEQTGTFTYANGALTLTFREGDNTQASATLENGVLKLNYNGSSYRLVQRAYFTVSFDVDGGSETASLKVLNGDSVAKPADPSKAGYAFIGWYTDKTYATPFVFDTTTITADTTVYARFEQQPTGQPEYTVSFACDGAVYAPVKTVNGVAYNLPTPQKADAEFVGWWVSDYQSAEKLTCRYTGQKLTQDTTLFAVFQTAGTPVVSVDAEKVTWLALGPNTNYRVTVKKGDTVLSEKSVGDTELAFDFSGQPAGEYSVTVATEDKSTTVYYKNKALDRVSNFRVVSNGVLVFNPVANAQSYEITVQCANANHTHSAVNNGKSTNFVFVNCDMPENGIVFVVTAKAEGYLDSTSAYTYFLGLDDVQGVTIDNEKITWYPVDNATAYYVEISRDGTEYTSAYVTSGTSYSIADLGAGVVYAKVTPVSDGYYSAPAKEVSFTKTTLAVPSGISVSGKTLTWKAVNGAVGYRVNIGGKTYEASANSLALTDEMLVAGQTVYSVSVQALGASDAEHSPYSAAAAVNYATMGNVVYENGYVRWDPVIGAEKYNVKVGARRYTVDGDKNSFAVSFVEAGNTTISVCFVDENDDESAWVSIYVDVFAIEFDTRGGAAVNTLYVAFGDDIVLSDTQRDGYDFAGWFTSPAGLASGKNYTAVRFEGNSDTVLYAGWTAKKYTVTLAPGEGGTVDPETVSVTYGLYNNLPVATHSDPTKLFVGWCSDVNGAGIRYTNEKGEALVKWNTPSDVTLYAHFAETLKFIPINNDTEYAVAQGDYGIGKLTSITIPATYNDLPVTTVESAAFLSCSTLVEINIPNTIQNIEIGTMGVNGVGSAFQSCTKLAAINIYEVAGATEVLYHSVDGVLYYNNEFNGMEIKCYPYAKSGVLSIEEGTTTIPAGVFRSSKITEVYIPYTVTAINAEAFYSCYNLTKIAFLPAPEGTEEVALDIATKAIYSCSKLTEVTLPSRMMLFTPDTIQSCSNLTSVDISGTDGNYTAKGEDGRKVLCNASGDTIVFCPKGMSGEFVIPNGVTAIGEKAFASCSKLTKLTIPGFVTMIGKEAFKSCSGLESLDLGGIGNPLTISESAFYSCSGLISLTLPERLVKMEVNAFGATSKLVDVTVNAAGMIPEGAEEGAKRVVDFATNAFGTSSTIPTFYVTHVTIGKDVPEFEITGVFGQKIEKVDVDPGNENYASIDGILFNKLVTKVVYYPIDRLGDYVLPETITEIGDRVFQNRTGLTGITIGKNVEKVGVNAFYGCNKLVFVKFEADGTKPLEIEAEAFRNCSALTGIELPSRLVSIGENAFYSCSKVTSFTIPEGVTTIGAGAFWYCGSMTEISLPATLTTLELTKEGEFTVFNGCSSLETITVAAGNNEYAAIENVLYQKTEKVETAEDGTETKTRVISTLLFCPQMKAGSTVVSIPGTVSLVASGAFSNNKVVTEIEFQALAKGVTLTIGANAFKNCQMLTKIRLPEGLETIPAAMFMFCETLQEVVIPSTVTSIEKQAFAYCYALNTLSFSETPEGVTPKELVIADVNTYSESPFYYCKVLKNVTFPERFTVLGKYAFGGLVSGEYGATYANAIETVSFPSTLKRIGDYAFNNALSLKSVTFAEGTTLADEGNNAAIGKDAFYYCKALAEFTLPVPADAEATYSIGDYALVRTALTSLTIPAAVKAIGNNGIYYNSNLTSITFAAGAQPTFGTYTFAYCGITSISLPDGTEAITDRMFNSCTALTSITVPSTVKKIGMYAFSGCTSLSEVKFATYEKDEKSYANVAEIGNYAFEKTALKTFTFPTLEGTGSLKLGTNLFNSCKLLDTIGLSKSVGDVSGVFSGCFSINNFVVDPESENFSSLPGSPILYNKTGTAYKYICGLLVGEHVIPDGVTEIGANVFEGQIALTKVVIPNSMQVIGSKAFYKCTNLETVIFNHSAEKPSQLTQANSLGTYMFGYCSALKEVKLPENITLVADYMFQYCTSLESISIPAGVTSIGKYAFAYAGLKSVSIPAAVKTIGDYAFSGSTASNPGVMTSLTFERDENGDCSLTTIGNVAFKYQMFPTVEIPKSVTTLGNNSFSYNPNLVSFTFEAGTTIKVFGTSLIEKCTSIESFVVPASVTTLGNSDFYGCTALKSVTFEEGSKLTFAGSNTFKESGIESIVIPDGVKKFVASATTSASLTSSSALFLNCTALKSVTLGSGTECMGADMFEGCTALESIDIPDSVTMIGKDCFLNCTALKSVNFGENSKLTGIGTNCFQNSGLESISLPAGVTVLGTTATAGTVGSSAKQFTGCANLKTVEFKGKLKLLGGYVFQGCTSLESVTLPATVTQIGNYCFDGCTSLTSATLNSSAGLVIGTYAFRNTGLTSITIPKGTTKLDNYSFSECTSLKTVEFAAGTAALTLGTYVFQNDTALESIALPDRLKAIPNYTFKGDSALTTITFNKVTSIGTSAFNGCHTLKSIALPATLTTINTDAFLNSGLESIKIPKTCTSIGANAFGGCKNLTTFTVEEGNAKYAVMQDALVELSTPVKIIALPGNLTGVLTIPEGATLGAYALNGLNGITEVILPANTTAIEDYAFCYASVKSVQLPEGVTTIGKGAFKSSDITSIVIPAGVTSIGDSAFNGCKDLKTVTFAEGSQLESLGTYAFAESGIESIVIPEKITRLGTTNYLATYTFKNCASLTSVTFLGELEAINSYAFQGCTALKSFVIPETVTVMGSYAFEGSGLESIEIPGSLRSLYISSTSISLAGYTFRNCTSLKTVILHEGLECINSNSFEGCTALESIVIPASVTEIGSSVFKGCSALKSVTFAEGSMLEKMGSYVFQASGLESIVIPENVTTLGTYLFDSCTSLKSVEFLTPITGIPNYTFKGCTALESFVIPATVTTIGSYAFQGSGLKSITIPATVTTLNTSIFLDCVDLEEVVFAEGCTIVSGSMFKGCTNLKSVKLASTINNIGGTAFSGCTSIKEIVIPMAVSTVGYRMFEGWTEEQTVKIECTEEDASNWTSTWITDCNATIVWGYQSTTEE